MECPKCDLKLEESLTLAPFDDSQSGCWYSTFGSFTTGMKCPKCGFTDVALKDLPTREKQNQNER
jgi:predicted nucleic-acid-binding Zn-ribbon protein